MPLLHFVDEELIKEFEKRDNSEAQDSVFPEHDFLLSSFNIGLRLNDLKQLTYVDVMKMFVCYLENQKPREDVIEREATQEDIDSFF